MINLSELEAKMIGLHTDWQNNTLDEIEFSRAMSPTTALALIRIARATLAYHISVKENRKERSIELHNALREIE